MKITILSLFPEILEGFFNSSIMARAIKTYKLEYKLVNIRDYSLDKHLKCDDEIYGGGPGMLLMTQPLSKAIEENSQEESRKIYMSASGRLLNYKLAKELSIEKDLVLICGHYEGIDQRVIDKYIDDEISIGDYIISSGEVAALVLIDAVFRLIPGVIKSESLASESFEISNNDSILLEYPQYTRPNNFANIKVPEVLLSGKHKEIKDWRLRQSIKKTLSYRPELLKNLDPQLAKIITDLIDKGE